jgi:F-type H+-transporting ATPase subunit epsilon
MAADTLDLEIVTPEGRKLSESVKEVTAPGALGELGVLPGHIPIPTLVDIGALSFVPSKGGGARVLAVGGGYLEVGVFGTGTLMGFLFIAGPS